MLQSTLADLARSFGLSTVMRAAGVFTRLLPVPQPTMMVGPGASARLGQAIADFGHRRLLVVTDAVIARLGLMNPLLDALRAGGTDFVVYDRITPDAPIPLIEDGIALYQAQDCDAVLAFGGGSAMDAAKAIAYAAANDKHPSQLAGYFRGLRAPAPIYAVPTTAGTGSEVTVAAVISDPEAHRKLVLADTRLVPKMAALDPLLMTGLPPAITAATGMDALTHAVEAYVGHWGTPYTDRMALSAVGMIYEYLPRAWAQGDDVAAREKMALASTYAGLAFTRANVGYVHAIAHQLGGLYHTPHGLANALVLPHVLRWLAPAITDKLAVLAVRARVAHEGEPAEEQARQFLASVEALNARLGIPRHLDALREDDIPALARAACREADLNYPVARYMSPEVCAGVIRELLPVDEPEAAPAPAPAPKARRPARKGVTHEVKEAVATAGRKSEAKQPASQPSSRVAPGRAITARPPAASQPTAARAPVTGAPTPATRPQPPAATGAAAATAVPAAPAASATPGTPSATPARATRSGGAVSDATPKAPRRALPKRVAADGTAAVPAAPAPAPAGEDVPPAADTRPPPAVTPAPAATAADEPAASTPAPAGAPAGPADPVASTPSAPAPQAPAGARARSRAAAKPAASRPVSPAPAARVPAGAVRTRWVTPVAASEPPVAPADDTGAPPLTGEAAAPGASEATK